MTHNIGTIDKVIRIILGLALIGWGVASGSWWGAIGIIPLGTALVGFCPLYPLVGMNTCGSKKETVE